MKKTESVFLRGFFFSVFLKEEQKKGLLDVDFIPKS